MKAGGYNTEVLVIDNGSVDFSEFKKHKNIRKAIASTIPGFEKLIELEEKDKEFQIDGRTFHSPHFNTEDGKANFMVVNIPANMIDEKMDFRT